VEIRIILFFLIWSIFVHILNLTKNTSQVADIGRVEEIETKLKEAKSKL